MAIPTSSSSGMYDAMRRRAQQQVNAQTQEQDDAMKRRFAANGMMNSGAYLKQQQIANDQSQQRMAEATQNIDFQEQAENQRREETQQAQQFQALEAQKQRDFSKGMFDEESKFKREVFEREDAFRNKEFEASQSANYLNSLLALAEQTGLDLDQADERDQLIGIVRGQMPAQGTITRGPSKGANVWG